MYLNNSCCFVMISGTSRIITWLREHYEFRFNIANHKMEFRPANTQEAYRYMSDNDFNSMKVALGIEDIPCSRETLRTIIFSDLWPQYNPYKLWLDSLPEWDGEDHISALANTVHTDDDTYFHWCLRKWLVAFVGSLAQDEVVNQTAIIFCGGQGIGKSSWFRNIMPAELQNYISSGYLQPKDKETLVQLSELCLYNMDEVENLKPANVEAIKEIMTKSSMYLRRAYTTLSSNYIRRCSFCGTANGINILHDITGNRRFLCQNVLSIDFQLTGVDLAQLYAQAFQLFRTGFQHWFDREEQMRVENHNQRFRATSIEEDMVRTYFSPCQDTDEGAKRLQAVEILSYLRDKVRGVSLSPETLGKIMNSMGFIKKKSGISKWVVRFNNVSQEPADTL